MVNNCFIIRRERVASRQSRELETGDHKDKHKSSLLVGKMVVNKADPSNGTLKLKT